ncbi:hypothetical protein PybrP1_002210 [[Pythium] brassicae (nom. inval.)]|nr:hypothetical protein PybrP1_002210 [[Pythium] brassicae (nom. inval.)]
MSRAIPVMNETSVLQGNVTGNAHLVGLPLAWVETHRAESLLLAAGCCLAASAFSVYNIYQHLQHYSRPQLQRYIVRILAIVPVYALGSLLSLVFVNQALYFDTFRDCYEAFVVYSFLALVLSFAGGESVCVLKMQGEAEITHAWPLSRCLHPIGRDGRLLRSCKRATIQFVLIKPFFALLSLLMLACGQYHTLAYQLILTVVYNVSYSLALYGLWLFYLATKHILATFNPVLKFFAVKSVVFLTFWQSGLIDFVPGITNEQSFAWKDLILCVEMVPFALLHFLAFNPSQFKKNLDRLPDSEVLKNMKEVLSLSDLIADTYHNFMPSYQDYMLQRGESTGRVRGRNKSVVVFGDDGAITNSSASESSSPTPVAVNNHHVPKFVIDDEDESGDEADVEAGEGRRRRASNDSAASSDLADAAAAAGDAKPAAAGPPARVMKRRFFSEDDAEDALDTTRPSSFRPDATSSCSDSTQTSADTGDRDGAAIAGLRLSDVAARAHPRTEGDEDLEAGAPSRGDRTSSSSSS